MAQEHLPKVYVRFRGSFPEVAAALDGLGKAAEGAGPLDERTVRLDPKINLEELEEILGVTFGGAAGVEDSETLGGLIYEAAGNVPQAGDSFTVAGLGVTVEDVADQRLVRVLLTSPVPFAGFLKREAE